MIKFGPSGNSLSFFEKGYKSTEQSAIYVREMNLDCFEYSFGRGVLMGEEKARSIAAAFKENGIEISAHAPYYINLAGEDETKVAASFGYILETARAVRLMGGSRVVFHPASQGKMSRETAVNLTIERLKTLIDYIYANGYEDIKFCPETMGKLGQIGTVEEITEFCSLDKVLVPTVDFGHVNAREQGSLKTEKDYLTRLEYMCERLGDKMQDFHVHFSKIQYTAKGELRHLTFADTEYGPEFEPFAQALHTTGLTPYIICESNGTQAEDAQNMKEIYRGISK